MGRLVGHPELSPPIQERGAGIDCPKQKVYAVPSSHPSTHSQNRERGEAGEGWRNAGTDGRDEGLTSDGE